MIATPKTTAEQELKNKPPPAPALAKRTKKRRLGKAPLIAGIAALALGGGLWGWRATHPVSDGVSALITDKARRGDLVESVTATGSVTAQTGAQVKIGSQITGRIKKLNADVGSQVKAGQIIAELDLPDIQAQFQQAKANLSSARIKLAQQKSGVGMQQTQTDGALAQAVAGQRSALARVRASEAAQSLQSVQTPLDIRKAQNGVAGARAALSTANSNLAQLQAGSELQRANARQQLSQARATAVNSALNLTRQQSLLDQGFVAESVVDQARATDAVNQSQILSATQNEGLVGQKITADVNSARNAITQSEQDVKTARTTLATANAGTYLETSKRADVAAARAALRQADASLSIARGNLAQGTLKSQDVRQAEAAVRVSEQQVAIAQAQVDKTVIRSPISGTVIQLASQQGETLAAGLSSPTLIVVTDLKRLQVDTYVDETDIGKVKLGQAATIAVDAFTGKTFAGKVAKIASGSTIQNGVITYDVTVALVAHDLPLKPDMTASVVIETGRLSGVLLVPSEAVKTGTKGVTVNVLTAKDGKPSIEARKVTLGGNDGVNTEILSGLKDGETIVLAGSLKTATVAKKPASAFGMSGGRPGGGGGNRGGGGGPP